MTSTTISIIDTNGDDVTGAASPGLWKVKIMPAAASANKGIQDMISCQPGDVEATEGGGALVKYATFCSWVSGYLDVDPDADDLFFDYLPDRTILARTSEALASGVGDWSKCSDGVFQERLGLAPVGG